MLGVFGEHNYGDPMRGHGYEYSNFLPALRNLGHEVELFDSFSRIQYADFKVLNRALLERVEQFQPDIVFCALMSYEVWLETLELIRNSGARLINWGTDDSWKYEQFSRFMAPAFDLWVTTSHRAWRKSQQDGLKSFLLSQWAARGGGLAEPLRASECRYPVSFVGSAYGNRPHWIAELKARGIDVACFGHGWPEGAVAAEVIPQIVRQSIISLNFGDSGLHVQGLKVYRSRQIKARVFEVPGAGGCLLTESAENLDKYYRLGSEIEVFEGIDDLAAKIRYLLANPEYRDALAQAGYQRTRSEHVYEIRFADLMTGLSKRDKHEAIDWAAFEAIAARHCVGPVEKLLRAILTMPFKLAWGIRRGPRAARRLVFECSWRLLGRRTYTAAGWPGRWFYRES